MIWAKSKFCTKNDLSDYFRKVTMLYIRPNICHCKINYGTLKYDLLKWNPSMPDRGSAELGCEFYKSIEEGYQANHFENAYHFCERSSKFSEAPIWTIFHPHCPLSLSIVRTGGQKIFLSDCWKWFTLDQQKMKETEILICMWLLTRCFWNFFVPVKQKLATPQTV